MIQAIVLVGAFFVAIFILRQWAVHINRYSLFQTRPSQARSLTLACFVFVFLLVRLIFWCIAQLENSQEILASWHPAHVLIDMILAAASMTISLWYWHLFKRWLSRSAGRFSSEKCERAPARRWISQTVGRFVPDFIGIFRRPQGRSFAVWERYLIMQFYIKLCICM